MRMTLRCVFQRSTKSKARTKMVLKANSDGMFRVNTDILHRINNIGEITITTLPDHYPVKAGDRLASMRIIPLATEERQIEEAEEIAKDGPFLRLLPYRDTKVGIIITGSEIFTGRIEDKFERVARKKLEKYPSEIIGVKICDDDPEMIVKAAEDFIAAGAKLLLFSGGMSVDPDDVTPLSIEKLGAEIVCYGVPSQPGKFML